jgi:hypothetical protein
VWVALSRVSYPFDLDFLEDDILVEAWRLAQGLPIFLPLNADFVPHAYGPLYMLLAAGLFKLAGPGFLPMRLLSFAATLASSGLLLWAAYRVSRRIVIALFAPGLFLAGYALTGAQYELARVDSLFVALVLAGTLAGVTNAGSRRGRIVAALCLALAFFAKQTAAVFGLSMAAYLVVRQRRRAIDFTVLYLAAIIVPLGALEFLTSGWSTFYLLQVPQGDPLAISRLVSYFRHDLLQNLGPLCALSAALVVLRIRSLTPRSALSRDWPLFALFALLASGWMRARLGGNLNSLLPAYAFLCLIPVLLYADLDQAEGSMNSEHARILLCLAVLWQFAVAIYNPLPEIPSGAMRESGQTLIERLRQTPGPVLVLEHPYYAQLGGKEPGVSLTALWHARFQGATPLPADLSSRIRSRYYALVITDEGEYPEVAAAIDSLLSATYRQEPQLNLNEAPPTLTGVIVRPRYAYVPGP